MVVTSAYRGIRMRIIRLSFQLITIRTQMLPMIVVILLRRFAMLLLVADFASLISLPTLLFSYPLLYS